MYVAAVPNRKSPPAILLRKSFRQNSEASPISASPQPRRSKLCDPGLPDLIQITVSPAPLTLGTLSMH